MTYIAPFKLKFMVHIFIAKMMSNCFKFNKTRENKYTLSFKTLISVFLVFFQTCIDWIIVSVMKTNNNMNFLLVKSSTDHC